MAARQEIIFRAKDLASGKIIEVAASMGRLRRIVKEVSRTYNQFNKSTKAATASLAALGLAPREPTREVKKLDRALDRLRRRAARLRPVLGAVFRGIRSSISRVMRAVFSLTSAFAVLGAGLIFRSLIRTSSEFENLRIQLNALQGSSERGRIAMEWIKDFAKTVPLSLQDVTKSFVTMRAFGMDPMDGTMLKLVDTTSLLGGKAETLASIVRAVGQMFTKGKIQAEEMNRQLTEVGVPAWDLLAKAMKRPISQLQAMASRGELGRKEIKLLIDEMGRFSKGAALAGMKTFTGLWSIFTDEISKAKDEFTTARNGLFDFTKALLGEGVIALDKFRKNGSLTKWGEDVAFSMIDAGLAVLDFAGVINMLAAVLSTLSRPLTGTLKLLTLIAIVSGKTIDGIIEGAERLIETFKGLGVGSKKAFDREPADTFKASIQEAREALIELGDTIRGRTQERLGGEILGAAQEPFKKPEEADGFEPKITVFSFEELDKLRVLSRIKTLQEIETASNVFLAGADAIDIANKQGQFDRQKEFEEKMKQLAEDGALFRQELVRKEKEQKIRAAQASFSAVSNIANALFIFTGSRSKALFKITKAANIASAIMDTYAAAAKALKEGGPFAGPALAASITALGLANVARISQTTLGGGAGGGGGGGGAVSPGVSVPSGFPAQQTQGPKIDITINTLNPASVDWDAVVESMEPAFGDLMERNGGNFGSVQLAFDVRGG